MIDYLLPSGRDENALASLEKGYSWSATWLREWLEALNPVFFSTAAEAWGSPSRCCASSRFSRPVTNCLTLE